MHRCLSAGRFAPVSFDAVFCGFLGSIQGLIRAAHEWVDTQAGFVFGDSDTDGDGFFVMRTERQLGCLNSAAYVFGDMKCSLGIGPRQKHTELVPTTSKYEVAHPDGLLQDARYGLQCVVPRNVPVDIIDLLEVI